MSKRVWNFCAGPCTLPPQVLEEAQSEFLDYHGAGMSLVEMSHRNPVYDQVHQEARSLALEVFGAPDDFDALFIQGGASMQFAMVPMNLLTHGSKAAYVDSGTWGSGAIADARHHGEIYTAWSGADDGYTRMPATHQIALEPDTRYLHITSNETIGGIRFPEWPEVSVPLVADMSSEFMARPLPWERFDLVYGGVQKNLGPAGMAIVFVRKAILEHTRRDMARYLRYDIHQSKESLFNTPPMFVIAMVGKMLSWMKAKGGLEVIEREAAAKSGALYRVIDDSDGYYRSPVDSHCRSHMNVVFRLASAELEGKFLAEASAGGMVNLKGHRSVGGCRASVYNAMPEAGVAALVDFMDAFRRENP